jgi:hypothetical protein
MEIPQRPNPLASRLRRLVIKRELVLSHLALLNHKPRLAIAVVPLLRLPLHRRRLLLVHNLEVRVLLLK